MAVASSTLVVIGTRRHTIRNLLITLSGNYVGGGDTLDLTQTTNPLSLPAAKAFSAPPSVLALKNVPGGYTAQVIPGNALNNNLVLFFTAEGTQLAAGAYPAALTAATNIIAEVVTGVNV